MFRTTMLNRLLELIYGFQTGVVTNGWVLHHVLGHHPNYLDQERDQSRWKRKDGQAMGEVDYSLSVALTTYPRAFQVGKRFPRHQTPFLAMSFVTLCFLLLFFYTNWVNALFIFALPMMISLYITSRHTYYHHAGLDTDNDFEASYNNTDEWFDFLTGNLRCHTAHHARPALH
jgi:fatty acid desaturase